MGVPVETDPLEALEHCLWEAAGSVAFLRQRLTGMGENPDRAWASLYGEWLDRQARLAKLCLDVGLEERRLLVVERSAKIFAELVFRLLAAPELALPAEKQHIGRALIGRWMRELEPHSGLPKTDSGAPVMT